MPVDLSAMRAIPLQCGSGATVKWITIVKKLFSVTAWIQECLVRHTFSSVKLSFSDALGVMVKGWEQPLAVQEDHWFQSQLIQNGYSHLGVWGVKGDWEPVDIKLQSISALRWKQTSTLAVLPGGRLKYSVWSKKSYSYGEWNYFTVLTAVR